jgi:hypothetical protein
MVHLPAQVHRERPTTQDCLILEMSKSSTDFKGVTQPGRWLTVFGFALSFRDSLPISTEDDILSQVIAVLC